ncbi:MAG: AAA family ATPase [Verrucomicrobiota bacterium]|nr:AAA family ATPase [Verrucomicrobiota bacterium]
MTTNNTTSEALKAKVRATIASGTTQSDLAKAIGISQAALSTWQRGIYEGSNDAIETAVAKYYAGEEYSRERNEIIVKDPPFFKSPTSERIWPVLRYNHLRGGMVAIVGGSGFGKSSTYDEYRRQHPNVWRVIATEASGSVTAMLLAICDQIGIQLTRKGKADVERAILEKLTRSRGLLIIDEGQYLERACLFELAGLREKAIDGDPEGRGIGIVVSGNEQIWKTIKSAYSQLFSRFGAPLSLSRIREGDIDACIDAWATALAYDLQPATREKLRAIGNEPGALRNIAETMRFAAFLAAGAHTSINHGLIEAAWASIGQKR